MNTFPLHTRDITFPTTWDELTLQQLRWIMENYISQLHHFIQPLEENAQPEVVSNDLMDQVNLLLVWTLSGIPLPDFMQIPTIDIDRLIHIEQVHNFILEQPGPLRNPIPRFGDLLGPADNFADLTADEFFCANAFLENYDLTASRNDHDNAQAQEYFHAFLACLYRPADTRGHRQLFYLRNVETNATHPDILAMDNTSRHIVRLWFSANISVLHEANPNAFSGGKKSEGDFVDLMLQLAKDGPFGNFEQVREVNISLLMKELDRVAREAQALKNQQKA